FGYPLRRQIGEAAPDKFPVKAGTLIDGHFQRPSEHIILNQLLDWLHRRAHAIKNIFKPKPGIQPENGAIALHGIYTFCPSPIVRVIGFSHQTSFPASAASLAIIPCQCGGVAICTTSISSCCSTSR